MNQLTRVKQAIRTADLDGLKSGEINMNDLKLLLDDIQKGEDTVNALQKSLRKSRGMYDSLLHQSLTCKPTVKIDEYF